MPAVKAAKSNRSMAKRQQAIVVQQQLWEKCCEPQSEGEIAEANAVWARYAAEDDAAAVSAAASRELVDDLVQHGLATGGARPCRPQCRTDIGYRNSLGYRVYAAMRHTLRPSAERLQLQAELGPILDGMHRVWGKTLHTRREIVRRNNAGKSPGSLAAARFMTNQRYARLALKKPAAHKRAAATPAATTSARKRPAATLAARIPPPAAALAIRPVGRRHQPYDLRGCAPADLSGRGADLKDCLTPQPVVNYLYAALRDTALFLENRSLADGRNCPIQSQRLHLICCGWCFHFNSRNA